MRVAILVGLCILAVIFYIEFSGNSSENPNCTVLIGTEQPLGGSLKLPSQCGQTMVKTIAKPVSTKKFESAECRMAIPRFTSIRDAVAELPIKPDCDTIIWYVYPARPVFERLPNGDDSMWNSGVNPRGINRTFDP